MPLPEKTHLLARLTELLLACLERMDRENHIEEQIAELRKRTGLDAA